MANDMPEYNTACGVFPLAKSKDQLLDCENVAAWVFPLKADMPKLREYCNKHLNIAPQYAKFEPAISYVYLVVLHYEEARLRAKRAGWVSQREVVFAVPLKWRTGDDSILHDWAWMCPYIFVDEDFSLVHGREVYGWPKLPVKITSEVNPWAADPWNSSHSLQVDAEWMPSSSARLLDITSKAAPTFSLSTPPLDRLLSSLSDLPQAIQKGLSTLGDLVGVVSDLTLTRSGEKQTPDFDALQRIVPTALQYLRVVLPRSGRQKNPSSDLDLTQITVKQFHDAGKKGDACYKALVESSLGITRSHRGGFLGDVYMLYGDPSGGFRIHLYNDLGKEIIKTLGLEHDDKEEGLLTPILPFWGEVDLQYGNAKTICWRVKTMDWQPLPETSGFYSVPGSESYDPSPGVWDILQDSHWPKSGRKAKTDPPPPEDLRLDIYPLELEVRKEDLEKFFKEYLKKYLNDKNLKEKWTSFELADTPYVYLTVTSKKGGSQKKETKSNTDTQWSPVEVAFFIPVKWQDGKVSKVGLVSPFVFSETDEAALIDRELNGRPTLDATMESHTIGKESPVLTVKTSIFPISAAERAEEKVLLEISHDSVRGSQQRSGMPWLRMQFRKGKKNVLQTMGLKQFRDAEDPTRACYQAIVRTSWEMTTKEEKSIDKAPRILLHSYDTLPIAETLGLGGGTPVELHPVDPFTVIVTRKNFERKNLFWRAGDLEWQEDPGE